MTTPKTITPPHSKQRQRGAALLIAMLLVVLGLVTLLTLRAGHKAPELDAERKTALALAQAKEALLGRAVSDADPGTLSCPSVYLNGVANTTGSDCLLAPNPSIIPKYAGRLPWKSLGAGDLYDGVGERLWYVMSPNFIDKGKPLIPTTQGTIRVNGGVPNVAAVIFAPGPAISGQSRSAGNDTILTNYLESYVDSATIDTAIIPDNDQIITITSSELFNLVTQRMAREFAIEVSAYFVSNGTYPPTNWVPDSLNWTENFPNWADPTVSIFTLDGVSPTKGTLKFPPCTGEFTIQRVSGKDVISGKVAC